ncbi:hypothetical protein JCM3766R1_005978 [Sporobolomyces carnicolor]
MRALADPSQDIATIAALVSVPLRPPQPAPQLPVEIIRRIIDSTACPFRTAYSWDFRASQQTLCSLCLVSRLFREIATPLRDRIIHVRERSHFDRWKEHLGRQDDVRALETRVHEFTCVGIFSKSLKTTVQQFEYLRTLAVDCIPGEIEWKDLEQLKHLTCLSFSNSMIRASRPFKLPRLTDLALAGYADSAPWTFDRSTTALAFPSLRILAYKLDEHSSAPLLRSIFHALSSQLDGAVVDYEALRLLDPALVAATRHKTLVDIDLEDPANVGLVPAARFVGLDSYSMYREVPHVASAISKLPSSSPLSLVYLPEVLSPDQEFEPKFDQARNNHAI